MVAVSKWLGKTTEPTDVVLNAVTTDLGSEVSLTSVSEVCGALKSSNWSMKPLKLPGVETALENEPSAK